MQAASSAPELRRGGHHAATASTAPTPANRLGFHELEKETPANWQVSRYGEPHMANYVWDPKCQFLRRAHPLGPAQPTYPAPGGAPPRKVLQPEEVNKTNVGWSVPHYDPNAVKRMNDTRFPRKGRENGHLARNIEKKSDVETRPGGLMNATHDEMDTPYGWNVKRFAPQMLGFHTCPGNGWRGLRANRGPKPDGSPPTDVTYMDMSNKACRDNRQRANLDQLTPEEHAKDIPYGWNVPRYVHHMAPRINREVKDPAAIFYGSCTPSAKFSAPEFRGQR